MPQDHDTEAPISAAPHETFGIAMHGTPLYGPADTHVSYANPQAPKGGAITYTAIGSFDTLNPFAIKGKAAKGLNLIHDRLMARVWDEPFSMYPLIAQSYDMPEDRSAITFHIDPRARFNDESPITVDDVLFSFETLRTKGRPNMRNVYRLVDTATIIDNDTITFTFKEGHDRETALIIAMMPVLSKAYWQDKNFEATTLNAPVSSGPYTIQTVDPGHKITYARIKQYWAKDLLPNAGHYNFDKITHEYYRDNTVAFEAFKAGESDIRREYDKTKWASAYNFPALENGSIIKETIPHQRPERAHGFIFNTRRAPFDDIRVRKALSYMLDYEWINKNIFYGQAHPITSFFPNSEFAYSAQKNDAQPQQSLRKRLRTASALLTEAGWVVENGKRIKNDTPFTFELLLSAPEEEKIALNLKKQLERLGIAMTLRVLDNAAFIGRLNNYDYDMVSYYWQSSLSPGTEQILYWGCAAAQEPARWNYPGICQDGIDTLAKHVAFTTKREDLIHIMKALDQKLIEGHYMIPLFYNGADYIAHNVHIKHPPETPIYGAVLETWWMEPQKH